MYCIQRLYLVCIALLVVGATPTLACEYHGAGFGYSPFGHFSPDSGSASQIDSAPAIKVASPSLLKVKNKTSKELNVAYYYSSDSEEPNIQLSVDILAPGISVAKKTVNVAGKDGLHTFLLEPNLVGSYRIRVSARDLSNTDVNPGFKTVFVKVYE